MAQHILAKGLMSLLLKSGYPDIYFIIVTLCSTHDSVRTNMKPMFSGHRTYSQRSTSPANPPPSPQTAHDPRNNGCPAVHNRTLGF